MNMRIPLLTAVFVLFPPLPPAAAQEKPATLPEARAAIESNLKTANGKHYDEQFGKEFLQKEGAALRQCKQAANGDLRSFWILLKLDKSGNVKQVLFSPATKLAGCAREPLLTAAFSPPPSSGYWVSVYLQLHH